MKKSLLLLFAALTLLTGCNTMKPDDFAAATPKFSIEDYFAGHTRAWGLFEDRFGKVRRQFVVDIHGYQDGEDFVLDEQFLYSDGVREQRVWRIRKTGENSYEGQAGDIIGIARGEAAGNALNWRYDMNLKIGGRDWQVHFNDWMFLQPSGVLLNRARVSKFGLTLGTVTLAFMQVDSPEAGTAEQPSPVAAAAQN